MKFKESKSIYLQIADRICDEILQGQYPEEERIPSVREYAALMIICKGWKSYTINEVLAILYRQELKSELSLFAKIPSCMRTYRSFSDN